MNNGVDYKAMYHAFREISTLMHTSRTKQEVTSRAVRKTTEILDAKGALLRLRNPETDQFEVAVAYGLGEWYLKKGPVSTQRILADLSEPHQIIMIEDILTSPRVEYPQEAWREGIRMMLDVPLSLDDDIIGMLRIYLAEKRTFSEEEQNFIMYTAEQCACAINKVRFIENQRAKYDHLALQTEKLSALGRMAAGIAHEINNPLGGILLFSSNLSKKVPSEGPLKEGLEVIIRETVRCKSIIQELLEFSRDREPQMAYADINDIIEKALSILENEFKLRHIQLEKDLTPGLRQMCLDANQMEQVFVNILINALQATPQKGAIRVASRFLPETNMARVQITDTGSGIAPDHLPRIFDPFFSTKEKGTGLGLAVSYGIVRNHNGSIRVASELHKGARFIIDLPVRRTNDVKKEAE